MTTKDLKCHNEDLVQPNKYASNKYIFKKKTKQVVFFKKRVKKKKKNCYTSPHRSPTMSLPTEGKKKKKKERNFI